MEKVRLTWQVFNWDITLCHNNQSSNIYEIIWGYETENAYMYRTTVDISCIEELMAQRTNKTWYRGTNGTANK